MNSNNRKMTHNTGETDVMTLFGNNVIFEVPPFQRPYKWADKRLRQLHTDLLTLVDRQPDLHFLGAIIIHGRPSDPGVPKVYEVIDGQQRLTTIYLHVCAVVKTLIDYELFDEAHNLFSTYLVTRTVKPGASNLTLHPCMEDRLDLNGVIHELLDNRRFSEMMPGFRFIPLSGTARTGGRIAKNYKAIKKFYRDQIDPEGIDGVKAVYTSLLKDIVVVAIDVEDPTNGPRIFDSLNSQQEPMTVGDLVRNDVFSRVASHDPNLAIELNEHYWQPFYQKFSSDQGKTNYFDGYFFPYALIDNHNLSKPEAYSHLRRRWEGKEPTEVIDELRRYQEPFLDLVRGTNECDHDPQIALRLDRLYRLGMPTSIYPFLMQLSRSLLDGDVGTADASQVLESLDSFLTRRAICGYEPTGLHAVFKRLWADCDGVITADRVIEQIGDHRTVAWPGDEEVRENVTSRGLYGTRIVKYLVMEYDESLGGDRVPADPWIEHVLPNSRSSGWAQFSSEEHDKYKNLFANLIPLSPGMNGSLGNRSYNEKRGVYAEDSMFKSARQFAATYEEWTPELLCQRGEHLASWCLSRWPHSPRRDR